jgi:hypothetical protein
MNKEFVPYEQSLELKGLDFNEPCLGAYGAWGLESSNDVNPLSDEVTQEDLDNQGYNEEDGVCLAPLYQQSFRFFREKYNLKSCIMFRHSMGDDKEYYDWLIKGQEVVYRHFNTYEEAELDCLKKLIELVKNK